MAIIKDIDEGTIRRVDWLEIVPPTIFFRAFSATFKFSLIALFALIIAGAVAVFNGLDSPNDGGKASEAASFSVSRSSRSFPVGCFCAHETPQNVMRLGRSLDSMVRGFGTGNDWTIRACVGGYCCLLLFLSLVAARSSAVRLATSARSSTLSSVRFAFRKIPSILLVGATPFVLVGVVWGIEKLADATGVFGAFCAPLSTLFIALFVLFAGATAIGTPLAIAALATENCDGFDAISRSVSYATQRFLVGLIYSAIALLLLKIGFIVVAYLANVSAFVYSRAYADVESGWIDFWGLVLVASPWAYLCHASVVYATAIYLLLRRSVDGTPYDACALNGSGGRRRLRRIIQDANGAPVISESNAKETTKDGNESGK